MVESDSAMNSRRKIVLFATLAVTIVLFAYDKQPKEPVYEGKPLSEWLEDLHRKGGGLHPQSAEALRQMGSAAVPHLKKMLQARDSWQKRKLIELNGKLQWFRLPVRPASYQNFLALDACNVLGQDAKEAIPEIEALLPEPEYLGYSAARALARTGPNGVTALAAGLASADPQVRHNSARGLSACRFDGSVAVPGLIKLLDDPDPHVAQQAAWALGSIHRKPELAVPALIRCAQDGRVRGAAAAALGRFGSRARGGASSLLDLVQDRSPAARHAAGRALASIDPDAADGLVPGLLAKLEAENPTNRVEAAQMLASMGRQPARVVPALMKHIPDPDPVVCEAVMYALSAFGGEAQVALPRLLERSNDVNTSVSTMAQIAVLLIDPQQAVPHHCECLNNEYWTLSDNSARQLGTFGRAAKAAVPDLLAAFRKGDECTRTVIREALQKIDPEAVGSLERQATDR